MTRLDALKALSEKVEAGNPGWDADFLGDDLNLHILGAWHGSLDAAKALHEAVLPGCSWGVGDTWSGVYWSGSYLHQPSTGNPARAWLLAILRALIAQEAAE